MSAIGGLADTIVGQLLHESWQGWRIDPAEGTLYAPNGKHWQPSELEYIELIFQTNRALWRRLKKSEGLNGNDPLHDPRAVPADGDLATRRGGQKAEVG
jgi:hypothetical protein